MLRICWAGAVGLLGLKIFTECYQGKYDFTECYRWALADYHLIFTGMSKCFVLFKKLFFMFPFWYFVFSDTGITESYPQKTKIA